MIETSSGHNPVTLLGMRVDRVAMDDALALVERYIQERNPRHILTADASMVVTAVDDPEFAAIAAKADLVTPDGAGILWATKRQGNPVVSKVSGVVLAEKCVALSQTKGGRA
jgi:N-acetylglucosaminyldiphosphoundecaprenol N-acetyl-beta-D-mannosaminyltransferase